MILILKSYMIKNFIINALPHGSIFLLHKQNWSSLRWHTRPNKFLVQQGYNWVFNSCNSYGGIECGTFEIGAIPNKRSMENSISRSSGNIVISSQNTSSKLWTTRIDDTPDFSFLEDTKAIIIIPYLRSISCDNPYILMKHPLKRATTLTHYQIRLLLTIN